MGDDKQQANENTDTSNPDPGYPSQATVNARNPDQQQNRERPRVQQEQDESLRKAETKKAVQEDKPDKSKGNENTQFSGKS